MEDVDEPVVVTIGHAPDEEAPELGRPGVKVVVGLDVVFENELVLVCTAVELVVKLAVGVALMSRIEYGILVVVVNLLLVSEVGP